MEFIKGVGTIGGQICYREDGHVYSIQFVNVNSLKRYGGLQREIDEDRVREITQNFHEAVSKPITVFAVKADKETNAFEKNTFIGYDGELYRGLIFDGQHTHGSIVEIGRDFILAKICYIEDEAERAEIFALFDDCDTVNTRTRRQTADTQRKKGKYVEAKKLLKEYFGNEVGDVWVKEFIDFYGLYFVNDVLNIYSKIFIDDKKVRISVLRALLEIYQKHGKKVIFQKMRNAMPCNSVELIEEIDKDKKEADSVEEGIKLEKTPLYKLVERKIIQKYNAQRGMKI